jgi:hypothetical protein
MAHGLPPPVMHMHGPPMHAPFHMPRPHMMPLPGHAIMNNHYDHRMSKFQQNAFHPLQPKYRQKAMTKAFKPTKLFKKPRRVLLIRQRNDINMPDPYEYQRQMSRVAQSMYERGINYNNNFEGNRYDNNNNYNNNVGNGRFNNRNFENQRRNNANLNDFNTRNWDIVTNGGNSRNYDNNRNFGNNGNLNPPHLREVVDTSNRVEISKNSVKSRNVGGSTRRQSVRLSKSKGKSNSLSGNTIDLTGSKVISSNKNYGTEILSSNLLDKSNSGIQSEKVNIRRDRIKSSTKRTDTSSRVTRLNSNNDNRNSDRFNNNNSNNNNNRNRNSDLFNNNNRNNNNRNRNGDIFNNNNSNNNNNNRNSINDRNTNSWNNMNNSNNKNTNNSNNKSNIGLQSNNNINFDNNSSNQSNKITNSNNNRNTITSNNNNENSKSNVGQNNNNKNNNSQNNNNINDKNINLTGLAGSLLDFTSMGIDASANRQNTGNNALSSLSTGSHLPGSGSATASSTLVNSNGANNAAASAVADLNGNSINSAGNLLSASDLLLIDGNGLTPAEVAATAIPMAGDVLSGVVDLSATGGNTNNIGGTNFDVLTLDKGAFAQLEHALQTGQTVNAQLLDSIISGGGTTNNGNGFHTSLSSPSATAGQTDPSLAVPQIIILDQAQAQHLTGSTDLGGHGGNPQLVDLHTLSSSSSNLAHTSEQLSSTASSSHSSVDVPHAGKVLPGVPNQLLSGNHGGSTMGGHSHGHGIVGILGEPIKAITMGSNSDLMGLFSMPDASNLSNIPASVVSIPESIGRRMPSGHQHSGQTDMSSMSHSTGHRMPSGHSSHSSHGAHCKYSLL